MKQYCKKMISILLLCSLAIGMAGCGSTQKKESDGRLQVVATVFAEYDFLRNIAGDAISLEMLMLPGADLHTFDPAPKDIMKVQDADLFVTIGGESDAWSDTIIDSIDNKELTVVRLMDCIDNVVEEEIVEGMQTEEDAENEEEEFDEHVWTSPKNAVQIVESLCDTLCSMDEANASVYRENTEAYVAKLEKMQPDEKSLWQTVFRSVTLRMPMT
jgi:zinc transport system substrate-binding protein